MLRNLLKKKSILNGFIIVLLYATTLFCQSEKIAFDSGRWDIKAPNKIVDHLGQKSLRGGAGLKDVEFENGIIEVDVAFDGTRCFGGFNFRIQSADNLEHFYIRPHKTNLPDALQYTPIFNGVSSWQLYSNEGFTAPASIPYNEWIHVRMEVSGTQARVYLNNSEKPALIITDLKQGKSKGAIGVFGPANGQVHFANFELTVDNNLAFGDPPKIETPLGIITDWELSQPFKYSQINMELHPDDQELSQTKWQKVKADPTGLVDIARHIKRIGTEPDCIFARTTIHSDKDRVLQLLVGYSDAMCLFLNGKTLYYGNNSFRSRDPRFLGILGLNEGVYLPLKKGENELLLSVFEAFGGWGFKCQDGNATFQDKSLTKMWEKAKKFKMPESVVYDKKRDVLYVTNYDNYGRTGQQFISKMSLNGTIEEFEWITGLMKPTGMVISKDMLYVVDRRNLVEIDLNAGKILKKYPIPNPMFPNDVTMDKSGNFYVSDSRKNAIYKFSGGTFEEWLKGGEISAPNGLFVNNNKLIVGNNGDNCLKSVDLSNKTVETIVKFETVLIDGIKIDKKGNYIVSNYAGKLYRITPSGEVTTLLDRTVPSIYCADFDYIIEKDMIIIPSLIDNRITAYKLEAR